MSTNPISTLTINCPIIIKPTAVSLAARVTAAYHIQLEAIFDPGMCIVTYVREKDTLICLYIVVASYKSFKNLVVGDSIYKSAYCMAAKSCQQVIKYFSSYKSADR